MVVSLDILADVAEKNRIDDWFAGDEEKDGEALGKMEGRKQEYEVWNEEEEEEKAARGTRRRGCKVCLIILIFAPRLGFCILY